MVKLQISQVIIIAIALIVISIVLPIALVYIGASGSTVVTLPDGTNTTLTQAVDPAVLTLFTILLPILVVIGIIMYFIPRGKG